jgi:hypothetical protein
MSQSHFVLTSFSSTFGNALDPLEALLYLVHQKNNRPLPSSASLLLGQNPASH